MSAAVGDRTGSGPSRGEGKLDESAGLDKRMTACAIWFP
jgi:hypothetical protein